MVRKGHQQESKNGYQDQGCKRQTHRHRSPIRIYERPEQQGFLDNRRGSRRSGTLDFPSVYRREEQKPNCRISQKRANPHAYVLPQTARQRDSEKQTAERGKSL